MRYFRATIKLILFLLSTWYHFSIIVFGNIISILGFNKIKIAAEQRKIWAQSVARIIGMKVIVKGDAPKPPFFLVSNHLSYIDVWVLFSLLECTFIAKSEVKSWPIIGFVLSKSGMLFVNRERRTDVKRVNEEISKSLTDHQGIVLFPEGTTSIGADILPFKTSLFQYPSSEMIPVSCASISYKTPESEEPAYKSLCWWDDTTLFKHLFYLFVMKEFTATVTFSDNKIINSNRKLLAKLAEDAVRSSFEPVIDSETYAKESISD